MTDHSSLLSEGERQQGARRVIPGKPLQGDTREQGEIPQCLVFLNQLGLTCKPLVNQMNGCAAPGAGDELSQLCDTTHPAPTSAPFISLPETFTRQC